MPRTDCCGVFLHSKNPNHVRCHDCPGGLPPAVTIVPRRDVPGDVCMLSALVRDLHAAHPDTRLSVAGELAADVFRHDPRINPVDPTAPTVTVDFKPTIDRSGHDHTARYAFALHDHWESITGNAVPRGPSRPDLILSDEERVRPDPEPYYVLFAGVKPDKPAKQLPYETFAGVVATDPSRRWYQLGALCDDRFPHRQRPIPGTTSLLGKTTLRKAMRWIAHAEGVLCQLSFPMVVASAFGVPCVAVGGGRENPWLFDGMGVHYEHAVGKLWCCATRGCWASAPVPGHTVTQFPLNFLCVDPVTTPSGVAVGRCMTLPPAARLSAILADRVAAKSAAPDGQNTPTASGVVGRPIRLL